MAGPSGFFLGGVAEGARNATLLDQAQQKIDEQSAQFRETSINKLIDQNVSTITGVIDQARKAGASPVAIRKLITPMIGSFQTVGERAGRDITPHLQTFDALLTIPGAKAADPKALTEIGKLRTDLNNGIITPDEFSARVTRLTREGPDPNTLETIRQKIASGQTLLPGEQRVYDDATKVDLLSSIIRNAAGASPVPAAPRIPDPAGLR